MVKPLISVIIPFYNVEKYFSICLDSILEQTYNNLEIICIDNSSTDSSLDIVKRYASKYERIVILHSTKRGPSAARNKGLDNAKGEYVTFVDSDDWIDKDYVETLYEHMHKFNTDLVISSIKYYHQHKKTMLSNKHSNLFFKKLGLDIISTDIILRDFDKVDMYSPCRLYKSSILTLNRIRFMEGMVYEDNIFNIEYYLNSKTVSFSDKECYYYRISRGGSITSSSNKYASDVLRSFSCIKERLKSKDRFEETKQAFYNLFFKNLIMVSRKKINVSYSFFKQAHNMIKDIDIKYINDKKMLLLHKSNVAYYLRYKIINFSVIIAFFRYLKYLFCISK